MTGKNECDIKTNQEIARLAGTKGVLLAAGANENYNISLHC